MRSITLRATWLRCFEGSRSKSSQYAAERTNTRPCGWFMLAIIRPQVLVQSVQGLPRQPPDPATGIRLRHLRESEALPPPDTTRDSGDSRRTIGRSSLGISMPQGAAGRCLFADLGL